MRRVQGDGQAFGLAASPWGPTRRLGGHRCWRGCTGCGGRRCRGRAGGGVRRGHRARSLPARRLVTRRGDCQSQPFRVVVAAASCAATTATTATACTGLLRRLSLGRRCRCAIDTPAAPPRRQRRDITAYCKRRQGLRTRVIASRGTGGTMACQGQRRHRCWGRCWGRRWCSSAGRLSGTPWRGCDGDG